MSYLVGSNLLVVGDLEEGLSGLGSGGAAEGVHQGGAQGRLVVSLLRQLLGQEGGGRGGHGAGDAVSDVTQGQGGSHLHLRTSPISESMMKEFRR